MCKSCYIRYLICLFSIIFFQCAAVQSFNIGCLDILITVFYTLSKYMIISFLWWVVKRIWNVIILIYTNHNNFKIMNVLIKLYNIIIVVYYITLLINIGNIKYLLMCNIII